MLELNVLEIEMSKYVIIKKSFSKNPYSGKGHLDFYTLWFHTVTKYENNEPYFSANLDMRHCMAYAIHKKDIAKMLKQAQNDTKNYNKQPNKESKRGHIFVLKLNSQKLKDIIKYCK